MADTVIQEMDTLALVKGIEKKNKKMQAILLQKLESIVDKNSEEYESFRKVILDESNNYSRAIVRLVFGDIDFMVK